MKKIYTLTVMLFVFITNSIAQGNVGIGTNSPNSSAKLDISTANDDAADKKGLLIPNVALTATNAAAPIASPATSLLVYNTATAGTAPNNVYPGYYYWDGTKWVRMVNSVKAQNGANISITAPNASASDPYVELGGPLVRPTTVSALTATNKMSFTGTGVDMFNVDGTTLSVDGDNDRVGVGLNNPATILHVKGNAGILNLEGTNHTYIQWYPQGIGTRKAWTGYGSSGIEDFTIANEVSGKDIQLNTAGSGNVIANQNILATQGIVTGKIEFVKESATNEGRDDNYHTVLLSNGYGATGLSAFATTRLEGFIAIQGADISNLLTTTHTWRGSDGVASESVWESNSTSSGTRFSSCDNCYHQVYCPDGYIVTGWEAYATSYLDDALKVRCTQLVTGYTTVESNQGVGSITSTPYARRYGVGGDDKTHSSTCPLQVLL